MKSLTRKEFANLMLDNLSGDHADGGAYDYTDELVSDVRSFLDRILDDDDIVAPSIRISDDDEIELQWEVRDVVWLCVSFTGETYPGLMGKGREGKGFDMCLTEGSMTNEFEFEMEGPGLPPFDIVLHEARLASKTMIESEQFDEDREHSRYIRYWHKIRKVLMPAHVLDEALGDSWRDEAIEMNAQWDKQRIIIDDKIPSSISEGVL